MITLMKKIFRTGKIKKKLLVSFVMVIVLMSIGTTLGAVSVNYTAKRYDFALDKYGFSQGDLGRAMIAFADTRSEVRAIIGYDDEEVVKKSIENQKKLEENLSEYMAIAKKGLAGEEERALFEKAEATMEEYEELEEKVIELGQSSDPKKWEKAQKMASEQLDPMYEEIYNTMSELVGMEVTKGDALQVKLERIRMGLTIALIVILFICVMTSNVLAGVVAKIIAGPIEELVERLKRFAEGDLKGEFPQVDTKDEVAHMIAISSAMAENISILIEDIKYCMGEMAKGNYAIKTSAEERYVGDFEELLLSIRKMNRNMNDTLHQIDEAAGQVSQGAENLADGAQSLAEGATEQAGAIEELVATFSDITEGVGQTAKRVEEAGKMSRTYAEDAQRSREEMNGMVEAMVHMSETSQKIGSIISEIEEIASQTNLLSLNASIEAARAGEAGKGFAVVASQIGKLADESAQSAVNTRNMIMKVIGEVETGTQAAEQTALKLDEVVSGINKVAEATEEASELTKVQAQAMGEAESALNQISEVVQSNSATAEESSATSEELSAQAVAMNELVGKFRLLEL